MSMSLITTDKILVKIRAGLDKDIKTIINIDAALNSYEQWEDIEFKRFKKGIDNVFLCADIGSTPVAYILLTLTKNKIEIARLVVTEALRRKSIGTQLIDRVKYGYLKKERIKLCTSIDEYNVPGQLFLQKNNFRANEIINEYGVQSYMMEYFRC